MTFGIDLLIQIVLYVGAIIGMWFTLKNRVNLIDECMKNLETKHAEDHVLVNASIDNVDKDVKELKEGITNKVDGLKDQIHENHLKVMQAIYESRA